MTGFEPLEGIGADCRHLEARCAISKDPGLDVRVALSGSLDDRSGLAFLRAFESTLRANPALCGVVLDLDGLRYASSTGVGAIAAAYLAATARGATFEIANPSPGVVMVLEVLGFDAFIPIARREAAGDAR